MPTMTRGPLSPVVYWRRRLVAAGVVLAFVLIVVNLVQGGGSSSPAAEQTAAPAAATTTPSPAPDDTTPGTTAGSGKGKKDKATKVPGSGSPVQGPSQPPLVAPTGACDDHDVLVAPEVDSAVSGTPADVTLVLRTKTTPACTWHVSASSLAIRISRFGNEIWSTRLCPNEVPISDVVVRQAVATTITVPWSTRRAEPGCPRLSDWAAPGHYRVDAASIGGIPAGSGFDLSPRTVVVTPPPSSSTPDSGSKQHSGKHAGNDAGKNEKKGSGSQT